jgi:hypothetical protein
VSQSNEGHMIMHRLFPRIWLALFFLIVFTPLSNAQDSCALDLPPHHSAINQNHGFFLFIFPREIGPSFSGCQTMWDERGKKLFVLTFKKGNLIRYEMNDPSDSSKKETCIYKQGNLVRGNSEECPQYEDVKNGFRTLSGANEPFVPPEKDPRKLTR